jgi:hypothetical protein
LNVDISDCGSPTEVEDAVLAAVRNGGSDAEADGATEAASGRKPIVDIRLSGRLSFSNALLNSDKIRKLVASETGAAHVRLQNNTIPAEFSEVEVRPDDDRDQIERRVFADLIRRDQRYSERAAAFADAMIAIKKMALADEPADKIAEFIAQAAAPMEKRQ